VVLLAATRRWRPVIFLAVVMFGELAAFLGWRMWSSAPGRTYPPGLEPATSAFPSGHMAATTCLYVAIAILAIGLAHGGGGTCS